MGLSEQWRRFRKTVRGMESIQIDPKEMLIFTGLNLLRTDFKSMLFW
jgi:hypothetical protein